MSESEHCSRCLSEMWYSWICDNVFPGEGGEEEGEGDSEVTPTISQTSQPSKDEPDKPKKKKKKRKK